MLSSLSQALETALFSCSQRWVVLPKLFAQNIKINMRKLRLCVLELPVGKSQEPLLLSVPSSLGLSGEEGSFPSARRVRSPTGWQGSAHVGTERGLGLGIPLALLPSSSSHSLWIQNLRVSLSSLLLWPRGLQMGYSFPSSLCEE